MNSKITNVFGKPIGRRTILAGGAAALAVPLFARASWADAKPFRISTPGSPEEWQSKALEVFKKELDAAAPGQFDVQIHYNGTLFAQGTEIEAMQRGNLEVGMISPQDIATLIPEYSIFTTGYLMRDPDASRRGLRRRHRQGVRGPGREGRRASISCAASISAPAT